MVRTYTVVVDDLSDHGNVACGRACLEEDDTSDLDEALERR